jgi:hypothetical protein
MIVVAAIIVLALALGLRGLGTEAAQNQATAPTPASNPAASQPTTSEGPTGPTDGPVRMADQGAPHIKPGESHEPYNSNPPTSGWHYDNPSAAGVYPEPVADETLVHNLEHGHVIISYNCANVQGTSCEELKSNLSNLFDLKRGWKIVVVPRPSLDTGIALTAWNVIDKFNTYDQGRIENFITQYRDQGPEKTQS